MSSRDASETAADAAFERALIESARADRAPLPSEAWARFAAASGTMAGAALTGSASGRRLLSKAAWKPQWLWMALGAMMGGAVTAALLWGHSQALPAAWHTNGVATAPAPALSSTRADGSVEAAAAARPASIPGGPRPSPLSPASQAQEPITVPSGAPRAVGSRGAQERGALSSRAAATMPTASTLAAEVAALDSARRAIAEGDYGRALRAADAYPRDFPRGQLTADAEALAIEALVAAGNHVSASTRAERFLVKYPNDPHVARIRVLIAQ